MTDTNQTTPAEQWTSVQAYVFGGDLPAGGDRGGWFHPRIPESGGRR